MSDVNSDVISSPWPYLDSMFKVKSIDEKTIRFVCLMCAPKHTECSAYANSPSNLKKHVERVHVASLQAYENLTAEARKRKVDRNQDGSVKKMKQESVLNSFSNANCVTQKTVDERIISLVVHGLLPLRIVELPEFRDLILSLQPNRHVMTRDNLRQRIAEAHQNTKQKLVSQLKELPYVATTTDCWSAHGKSYIGVTVHWIDSDTLQRKSGCLALRRLKGSHTFDVIASVLDDIHTEYGIRRKILKTTTDNGSNFVKAFSMFGDKTDPMASDELHSDDDHDNDEDEPNEGVNEVYDLSESFLQFGNQTFDYQLPRHQRCACHTLNLIATTDADKAENDAAYKRISRCAFAKCSGLWNKYGRSAQAAEIVNDLCGLGLKRPNATRWNSVFLAVERLVRLINEKGEDHFNSLCTKLELPKLTSGDIAFLTEYASTMRPVAQALNILQSENKMAMGYLLPTITTLREKLVAKKSLVVACKPLIAALLDGIDRRFAELYDDPQTVAASIIHPKFKTTWTSHQPTINLGVQFIKDLLATKQSAAASQQISVSGTDSEDEDDFFKKKPSNVTVDSLTQYLHSQSEETMSIAAWPELKDIYIQLNTPLPASAAAERLFSCAGLTMTNKRTRMTDTLFENLVFLKCNQHLY